MKKKLIAISVGYILILSACGNNNESSKNEYRFNGTWELIDKTNTKCPPTIVFSGKDKMVWKGFTKEGDKKTAELQYTRIFEDEFQVKLTDLKVNGKTTESSEEEKTTVKMIRDNDRLRLVNNGNSCTYSLK
ncbi:hypothetical protein ABES33_00070 [Bacillus pseudomycoides]|uniref:hypothetical protein n=1 Tax=Bacillus TaxID=1386 RepID=UPI0003765A50|nr:MULTISPECIES: hypothetical protein [Bacillus]PEP46841.1 hypothetical protein CN564_28550 [Bacillus pseudomycoides]PGR99184.1 hypothetical protein COC54_22690 [Bacillus pseudomycoides]PHC92826.1 hypothetical protein COF36_18220 [Bacillus pseudomycoides]